MRIIIKNGSSLSKKDRTVHQKYGMLMCNKRRKIEGSVRTGYSMTK